MIDGHTLAASRSPGFDAVAVGVWLLRATLAAAAATTAAAAWLALRVSHQDVLTWIAVGAGAMALALLALRAFSLATPRMLRARGWLDPATGLCNLRALPAVGALLLRRARRGGQPLSLVLVEFQDLLQARRMYGGAIADRLLEQVVQRFRTLAAQIPGALAIHAGRARFAVLLPGWLPADAVQRTYAAMGAHGCIEYDAGDVEVVLIPEAAGADVIAAGTPVFAVFHDLLNRIEAARVVTGGRAQLARRAHARGKSR